MVFDFVNLAAISFKVKKSYMAFVSQNKLTKFNTQLTFEIVMDELILETRCAKVYYNPDVKLGKVVWDGTPNLVEYKEPFLKLIEHSKKVPISNFLSDTTKQGVVNPEIRKWFEKEMLPSAMKAGLKRAAAVSDSNVLKRYYINMIIGATNKFALPVKVFSKEEEAIKWFIECEK